MPNIDSQLAEKALNALAALMNNADSETARLNAAKILLERNEPEKSNEEQKREEEERTAALVEAQRLLEDFADTKSECLCFKEQMAENGEAGTSHAEG